MSKHTELYIWGSTENRGLLLSEDPRYCSPRFLLPSLTIHSISLGLNHSLFLTVQGEVYSSLYPHPQPISALKSHKIASISSGYFHSAALTSSGILFTWGSGDSGALGLTDLLDIPTPQRVNLPKVSQISCGARHTASICSNGLFMWGAGSSGQLGNSYNSNQALPGRVLIEDPLEVACGIQHTLVLVKDGGIFGFGANSCGQLGTGNKRGSLTPVSIDTTTKFKKICAGSHSAGISADDRLYIWGTGLFGEWLSPRLVSEAKRISSLSVSGGSGYALDLDGKLWSWGSNSNGELGLGDFDQRTSINCVDILNDRGIRNVFSGGNLVIAIGKDVETGRRKHRKRSSNKENIYIENKEDSGKKNREIENLKSLLSSKENKIKLLEDMVNEEEMARIQKENEYFRNAFEEMKKFKQQCYYSLSQESEKRKFAESFVKDLHSEHQMLLSTIRDLEMSMSKLAKQCEVYQEKASHSEDLLAKVKQLTADNERLKSGHSVPETVSKRYTADLSFESITMASPDISLVFDRHRNHSAEKTLRTSKSSSELLKLFEVPEPIRSVSPSQIIKEIPTPNNVFSGNDPQTPPTFRDGGITNSGAIKNSLSEIRARLNLLQENKLDLEGKMNDFEKKLREQV